MNGNGPNYLSGHTGVVIGSKLYIYGGRLSTIKDSNILYELNLLDLTWSVIKCLGDQPIGVDGHSAIVLDRMMIIFGGFSPSPEP